MTCTSMQKIFLNWMLSLRKEVAKVQFQAALLRDIFRVGCFSQLVWFQETLKYISKTKLNKNEQILVAIEGD